MCSHHGEFSGVLVCKGFSGEISGDTSKCEFLILYNKMHQHFVQIFTILVDWYF